MPKRRSEAQKIRDQKVIARLYLKGKHQADIALIVGTSQPTVSRDLKEIQARWKKEMLEDISRIKAIQLAKIDELERQFWNGFVRSTTLVTTERVFDDEEQDWIIELIEEPWALPGDPRFLDGVRKCITDRCNILGIEYDEDSTDELVIRIIGNLDLENDI